MTSSGDKSRSGQRKPMAVRMKQVASRLSRSAAFRAETLRRAKLVKTR